MKNILLTGAFGNVGQHTVERLCESNQDYKIRCFDLKNRNNEKVQKCLSAKYDFETVWGDIRDETKINQIIKNIDCIIHLAAIIPPLADELPKLAYSVNVEGSRNLIKAAESQNQPIKFIFASSVAVFGSRMNLPPPRTIHEIPSPLKHDNYAKHKVIIEEELKTSDLNWTILRFGVVTPFEINWNIPALLYEVPLNQRVEICDTRDVALACTNAINAPTTNKILLIGGGKDCQMLQKEYIEKMLNAMGIGMLPDQAFKVPTNNKDYFHLDWLDTTEAQEILGFQEHSFEDFVSDFKEKIGWKRIIFKIVSPIIKVILLSKSPYLTKKIKEKKREKTSVAIS